MPGGAIATETPQQVSPLATAAAAASASYTRQSTQEQEEIKFDSIEQAQEAKRLRIEADLAALRQKRY